MAWGDQSRQQHAREGAGQSAVQHVSGALSLTTAVSRASSALRSRSMISCLSRLCKVSSSLSSTSATECFRTRCAAPASTPLVLRSTASPSPSCSAAAWLPARDSPPPRNKFWKMLAIPPRHAVRVGGTHWPHQARCSGWCCQHHHPLRLASHESTQRRPCDVHAWKMQCPTAGEVARTDLCFYFCSALAEDAHELASPCSG